MNDQKSVPSISKDAPLRIEDSNETYEESKVEKQGKMIFIFGSVFAILILISVWILFAFWVTSPVTK